MSDFIFASICSNFKSDTPLITVKKCKCQMLLFIFEIYFIGYLPTYLPTYLPKISDHDLHRKSMISNIPRTSRGSRRHTFNIINHHFSHHSKIHEIILGRPLRWLSPPLVYFLPRSSATSPLLPQGLVPEIFLFLGVLDQKQKYIKIKIPHMGIKKVSFLKTSLSFNQHNFYFEFQPNRKHYRSYSLIHDSFTLERSGFGATPQIIRVTQ